MNEREFGSKIVQTLDSGLELPAEASARLAAARAQALASQRRVAPSFALVMVDGITARLAGPSQWLTHVLLPAVLIVGALIVLHNWQDSQQRELASVDAAELDTQLLKGDLPIDAYLDRGFQAWLKRSSE